MGRNKIHEAVCPYLNAKGIDTILCEGVISPTARHLFKGYAEMALHYRDFCCGDWRKCRHARAIGQKNDDPVLVYTGEVRGVVSDMLDNVVGLG